MQFTPIAPRETAVDACAGSIRAAILRGELAPGERLPAERTLAKSFGVGRVTVRSALAQLAAGGLLRVRQGSGYIVQDFRRAGGPELLPKLADLGELRAVAPDLMLVRRQMARAVLERVVASASAAEVDAIEAAVDRFEAAVDAAADAAAIAEADLGVLSAILDATGSPVLRLCFNPVLGVLAELPALRDAIYAEPRGNLAGWRLLVAWLRSGDADRIDDIVAELSRRDAATLARIES
jgi:GntR family transcriptional repressor for pyruvate dehydrogenase complex